MNTPSMGAKKGGSASTFADMANVDATLQEECVLHANTYYNNYPEGQSEWAARAGAITKFAIFTPLSEGPKIR